LYRVSEGKCEKVETDQPVHQVTEVVVDRRGRVWMVEVTFQGLFVFDGKRFRDVKAQTPLADEHVQNLRMDAAGNVLIDARPRPGDKVVRAYRWDATAAGVPSAPVEVKN